MRTLVTGGAGFVGTNLIKRLLKDGHEVISIDNYSTGKKENEQRGCDYYDKDLSKTLWWALWDTDQCEVTCDCQIEGVDLIFHLAALPRIAPSFEKPVDTFKSGPMTTINVLEWARHWETPVIYAGSSSVTGDVYANPYTFTKWQNEHLLELYNKIYDLPVSICRFYNVYGEYQANEGLIKCGEAHLDVWGNKDVNGQSFELGNGNNRSINELARAFGETYPTKYIDARKGEMRETLNTDTKAQDILGWKPKGDIIKFIKENYVFDK